MKEQVLYVHVGEPEGKMRDRALAIAKALDAGKEVEPRLLNLIVFS